MVSRQTRIFEQSSIRAIEQSMGRGLETRYDVLIAAQTGRFRYNILKVVPLIVLVAQLFVILHV